MPTFVKRHVGGNHPSKMFAHGGKNAGQLRIGGTGKARPVRANPFNSKPPSIKAAVQTRRRTKRSHPKQGFGA